MISVTQARVALLQGPNGIASEGGSTVITGEASTEIKGGGSSITLDATGVKIISAGGQDMQMTGVADGVAPMAAVNRRQLDRLETQLSGGIASAIAMVQLPEPAPGSNYSVGAGAGFYNGESALATGGAVFLESGVSFRAAYSYSSEGGAAFGFGAGYSW